MKSLSEIQAFKRLVAGGIYSILGITVGLLALGFIILWAIAQL